jgi:cyclase
MKTFVLAALAFCFLVGMSGAAQTAEPFLLKPLDNGAWASIDNAAAKSQQSGSNAGFVIGSDSVLVVDTFENPLAAQKLLATIRQKTTLPVRFVVNTHYHLDHVAGNGVFAAAGATILAQQSVRKWERTENLKFFGDKITAEQRSSVEALRLPDVTYSQGVTLYLGGDRVVLLRAMPGHTGGDTVVYDAQSDVVFCGDLFWNHTLPNLIDASTKEWIETLDTLVKDYPSAVFVPGHGDNPGKADDVRTFRDYLSFLRDSIAKAQANGASSDAVVKVVLPQIKAKYGDWAFFAFAVPDIQRTDEELRGLKRLPQ